MSWFSSALFQKSAYILLVWFLFHTAFLFHKGCKSTTEKADFAVVLGNKVELSGEVSPHLRARLDVARDLFSKGGVKRIITSGGIGKEGYDEASVMADYLILHGVPKDSIVVDSNGYTTIDTARNVRQIVRDLMVGETTQGSPHEGEKPKELSQNITMIVVSHYYHIARCILAFQKVGFAKSQIFSAYATDPIDAGHLYAIVREIVAYYVYLLFVDGNQN